MALAAGTKLGSYEVLAQIGAGGMGEVYQAHDTKLGRDVAIKVLPAAFVNDPERLSRFQREARMLAALNHPNIATIYGLEHSNGTHFLIMELVPGETLAERVRSGPVPVEEALEIGVQIAEALEAAHEKAIIHRDLKPANVKVTPEGKVKVLDFGLAKAFEGEVGGSDLANSPTLSAAATMQGVILGTAAYMSPEQARGKTVDKRTDIWAFGCVLYELLTRKQAFHGETTTEILAAVLKEEPDWQAVPETTPLSIRALLRRCLQKEMIRRARDAGDARIEMEEALAAPTTLVPTSASPGTKDWRQALTWIGGLILSVVVAIAVWNLKPSSAPASQPVSRLVVNLPQGQQLAGLDNGPALALSPDGTRLAYVARQGESQQLYLRALDSLEARPIRGTEGAVNPFFASDSQWVGFFAGGKLMKVSVSGGAALTLADAGGVSRGASWSSHGMISFVPTNVSVLRQMSDAGGAPESLTNLEKGEFSHRWPDFLPGGNAVFFVAASTAINWNYAKIVVQSVGKRERVDLIQGGTQPQYSPSGHLIYAQGGT